MASRVYEPAPRWCHYSAAVGGELHIYGGRTEDFINNKGELAKYVHSFSQSSERWQTRSTTGKRHPGLYAGACTSIGHVLYLYGGTDGPHYQDSLHQLDINSLKWSQLPSGPSRKTDCGMVSYKENLLLFGGYGHPSGPNQPGAEFVRSSRFADGRGWTNELHMFDVQKRLWSSPTITGTRPPPCGRFSLTMVDVHHAVLFGGNGPTHGYNTNVYVLDLVKMHWSVLERDGERWPVGREYHAAVCLCSDGQLLITGGLDEGKQVLIDTWLLDLWAKKWKEVDVPGLQARFHHNAAAFTLCPEVTEVTLFGGCPQWPRNYKTHADLPQIANTTILQFEYQKHLSTDDMPMGEWILTRKIGSSQLGTKQRIEGKAEKLIEAVPTSLAITKPPHKTIPDENSKLLDDSNESIQSHEAGESIKGKEVSLTKLDVEANLHRCLQERKGVEEVEGKGEVENEVLKENDRKIQAAEIRADTAERRAMEAEKRLKEALEESEKRVQVAERKAIEAVKEKEKAEDRMREAVRRCNESQQQAMESAERALQAEKRLGEAIAECNRRVQTLVDMANAAESRAIKAERRLEVNEMSLKDCKEKLQQQNMLCLVKERKEIQLTGPEKTGSSDGVSHLHSLTMSDHYNVSKHLRDLSTEDLHRVGGALGLYYPHLRKMSPLLEELVVAWLNREDNVQSASGDPSWATLIKALRDIDQPGIADKIARACI